MLSCSASTKARSATTMAACRVSSVDQRFAQSTSTSSLTGSDDRQRHVSPFHVGLPSHSDHSVMSSSGHRVTDDQPLDLTGGGAGRKRRGAGSPLSPKADVDSPLDLSVKRPRTDDAATRLSTLSTLRVDQTVAAGARGGLAMCGGGVVGHSPLRSVHVARSPVPLAQLHAAGQQLPSETSRLGVGVGVGAVPVIRRVSSTSSHGPGNVRGLRTCGTQSQPRPPRTINDGSRLSNARSDIAVVVNGHRTEVLVGAGTKDTLIGSCGNVVRPAFTRTDYSAERQGLDGTFSGRQSYIDNAYDRGGATMLGGRSPIEPIVAGSPTPISSVCSAYVTPPPPVRPSAVHRSSLTARRLDPRPKLLPTLAPYPESGSSLMTSHRVTLVDRLDPTETLSSSTFMAPNVVAPSSLNDPNSRPLYFSDRQSSGLMNATDNSADQLRRGFASPVWNSLTADVADCERRTSMNSVERSSAFGAISTAEKCVSEADVVDDGISSGDGASTIVAERNIAVTQMVDFVERQRAPLTGSYCTSGGSLLGHTASATRRVPVANVHPIMKDATKNASVTMPLSSTGPGRHVPPTADDDTCSQLSMTTTTTTTMPGRPLDAAAASKDVAALLAAGLSRGGRVSSHHMEYVKFLSQSVDDTASVASSSVGSVTLGQSRPVRGQQPVDRRRGSTRGGLACLSAKARRQLLPYFHHDDANDDQRQPTQTVADKAPVISATNSKSVTTESKNVVSAEYSSTSSSLTSSVSVGRKTTPIVYFDDDESTEAPSTTRTLTPRPQSSATSKQWRQSATRKQPGKLRKMARAVLKRDELQQSPAGKPAGTSKRRKRLTDQTTGDGDLMQLGDAQPSTSTQGATLSGDTKRHVKRRRRTTNVVCDSHQQDESTPDNESRDQYGVPSAGSSLCRRSTSGRRQKLGGSSRGRMSRGRGAVARYHTALRHGGDRGLGTGPAEPYDPAAISATSPDQTEQLSDMVDELTEDDVGGRQSKVGGGARRKAGSGRIGFQYPDVFGRRRTRGGAAGAGRRRAITSGRINFRHRTPLAQPDDVTSGDIDNGPEASLNTALSGSVEDPLLSVQRDTSQSSTSTSALPGPSTSLAGVRQLVPRPRRLYKRRRPSQLVPRPMASSSRSSRAAMLSMIECEGAGETALHKATRLAYEELVCYFLESGSLSANVQDNDGRTALHISCAHGSLSLTRLLLAAGAHPNCKTVDGTRPLHCAVAGNHVTIVRELLRCGADVTKQNGAKRSVLQLAKGRAVRQLIHGVLCDLKKSEDQEEIRWEFPASFDRQKTDVFDDVPPSDDDEPNQLPFDLSSEQLSAVYRLQPDSQKPARNYLRVSDVTAPANSVSVAMGDDDYVILNGDLSFYAPPPTAADLATGLGVRGRCAPWLGVPSPTERVVFVELDGALRDRYDVITCTVDMTPSTTGSGRRYKARQQNTSTSSSSASSCCDESVQSSTTVASPSTSTNQKDRQRANTTPYSHSKLLQPTVVLRHWSGVSDRSASSKVKEAKFAEFSRRNDVQRVASLTAMPASDCVRRNSDETLQSVASSQLTTTQDSKSSSSMTEAFALPVLERHGEVPTSLHEVRQSSAGSEGSRSAADVGSGSGSTSAPGGSGSTTPADGDTVKADRSFEDDDDREMPELTLYA